MKNNPSDTAILKAIDTYNLASEFQSNYIEQIKIAFEFIDAQLCSGDSNGPNTPCKHRIEEWAGTYICHDAVLVGLKLHGIKGLSKIPVFPRPHRLSKYEGAGSQGYSGSLFQHKDNFRNSPYELCQPDWLGYRGVEPLGLNKGRRIIDLIDAIEELQEVQESVKSRRRREHE